MERDTLAQPSFLRRRSHLDCAHSFLGRFRFHVLAQIMARLVARAGPSNGLATRLRLFRSHLGLDGRPLRREVETDLPDQQPPPIRA